MILCTTASLRGASWGLDDVIVFGTTAGDGLGLSQVPAGGGTLQAVTTLKNQGERSHRFPEILPGGRAVLFTVTGGGDAKIAALSFETAEMRTLTDAEPRCHVRSPATV